MYQQVRTREPLGSADSLLTAVINEVHNIVGKSAKDWTCAARRCAMERLNQIASQAIVWFKTCLEQEIWIKNTAAIVGCLGSIRSTAFHAKSMDSRCWGRSSLRAGVAELEALLGNGCAFEMETQVAGLGAEMDETKNFGTNPAGMQTGGEVVQMRESALTDNAKSKSNRQIRTIVDPKERPYTIGDLMILHNLSRRTVSRIYENEPGVLIRQASEAHQNAIGRRYRTIRVPRNVYLRVKYRMENK